MPMESRHTAHDTILSAGSKGHTAHFHFVPVSAFACQNRVRFHQVQGEEPGELGEMATVGPIPARGLPASCRCVQGRLRIPVPLSLPSHLRNEFGMGCLALFLSLPACCQILFFLLLIKAMKANPLTHPEIVQSWLWLG